MEIIPEDAQELRKAADIMREQESKIRELEVQLAGPNAPPTLSVDSFATGELLDLDPVVNAGQALGDALGQLLRADVSAEIVITINLTNRG